VCIEIRLIHPMIARAISVHRQNKNYSDGIARQLASMIGALPSANEREDELRRIHAAVQRTRLPQKFRPALDELAVQIIRLLGGLATLKAVDSLRRF
jgi:hypothetical protein